MGLAWAEVWCDPGAVKLLFLSQLCVAAHAAYDKA